MRNLSLQPNYYQLPLFNTNWISRHSRLYVFFCSTVIALVSVYDAYLIYAWQGFFYEQNPICRRLIAADPDSLSVFFAAKAVGTITVLMAIELVYRIRQRMGLVVATGLFLFQLGLVLFLNFADYKI